MVAPEPGAREISRGAARARRDAVGPRRRSRAMPARGHQGGPKSEVSGFAEVWRARERRGMLPAMAATPIDNDARAQQLARAIASDIQLYNKQKIEEALINDNFFEALAEEITEG